MFKISPQGESILANIPGVRPPDHREVDTRVTTKSVFTSLELAHIYKQELDAVGGENVSMMIFGPSSEIIRALKEKHGFSDEQIKLAKDSYSTHKSELEAKAKAVKARKTADELTNQYVNLDIRCFPSSVIDEMIVNAKAQADQPAQPALNETEVAVSTGMKTSWWSKLFAPKQNAKAVSNANPMARFLIKK